MTLALDPAVLADLAEGKYAFIDAGCADGRSLDHCERRFARRPGLGIDWYGADLERARRRGFAAAHADLASIELPSRCVDFVSMIDFLEHLPDEAAAKRVLERCGRAARDFLFIRHPSFEDVAYLRSLGLKIGWTEWTGHPNMMRIASFRRIFAELGWHDYVIVPDMPLLDSGHPAIVPVLAPADIEEYDPARHGPKPAVEFTESVYGKFDIFVRLNPGMDAGTWERITNVDGWRAVWESRKPAPPATHAVEHEPPPSGRSGRLARLFDPWLSRLGAVPPDVPAHLEAYLDNHVAECVRLERYFFLRLAHLMDAVGRIPKPVTDVLSIGAGVGYQEAFLAGRFPSMRVRATDSVLTNPEFPMPNLRFEALDVRDPPGPEQYDLVFSIECLEHLEDYREAFRHHAARVGPGKYLYVSVPFASRAQQQDPELRRRAWELCGHVTPGFTFEDLEELFSENGLDVLHASNMFHLDVVLPVRHVMETLGDAERTAAADALSALLLFDLQDRRAASSLESEGIRFLGRKAR